mmetsp:Transcript_27410/g.27921  ORF Transcript_27410/g.27921 Transcript_27410/m.27921 type:complete len:90 (+) Transcript_27410:89-358(+)
MHSSFVRFLQQEGRRGDRSSPQNTHTHTQEESVSPPLIGGVCKASSSNTYNQETTSLVGSAACYSEQEEKSSCGWCVRACVHACVNYIQ